MLQVNSIRQTSPQFKDLTIGPTAQKVFDHIGNMKSPQQRLAFGVAALAIQPVIDRFNPFVDTDTRKKSAVRSAAKAIACSATGVVIREACILGTNALLNNKQLATKLPEYMTKDKNHASAVIGTLMGLGIMVFTNFLIDVPLTDKLTEVFAKMTGVKLDGDKKPNKKDFEPFTMPAIQTPAFTQTNRDAFRRISQKIQAGELPPMSQVNTEVIKWAS